MQWNSPLMLCCLRHASVRMQTRERIPASCLLFSFTVLMSTTLATVLSESIRLKLPNNDFFPSAIAVLCSLAFCCFVFP
jgi:hypothetical protein